MKFYKFDQNDFRNELNTDEFSVYCKNIDSFVTGTSNSVFSQHSTLPRLKIVLSTNSGVNSVEIRCGKKIEIRGNTMTISTVPKHLKTPMGKFSKNVHKNLFPDINSEYKDIE